MIAGYARTSTADQNRDLQIDALRIAGCERIVEETASGSKDDRPQLRMMLDMMRQGDVLVVWKLDRLGRSMAHLVRTIDDLNKRGIGFRCLTQDIDTTTAGGRLVFGVFAAIAEFERAMIIERTNAGLAAARRKGIKIGPPHKLTSIQVAGAKARIANGQSIKSTARELGVHGKTLARYLDTQPAGS